MPMIQPVYISPTVPLYVEAAPAAASVGIDEAGDQIITPVICVHQIFEINGSR